MTEAEMTGTEQAGQPGRLSVVSTASDSIHVITLNGEVDHQTGEPLRQALQQTRAAAPGARVVVDMRGVGFMDSSGINILITAHHDLTKSGGWLRLTATTPPVLRVLHLVGVDAVIDCRDTIDQALAP
ncbi:STAS domain-containing protein [Streptomyces sp. NPDC058108]|uniref:STAS domain-containing protein n=1 Tax=Streptomyces sp. NPDC058108 TaxID=3346344 RepID=UPI0036EE1F6C